MFIYVENFYEKTKDLKNILSSLDFKSNSHGDEIINFNMISQGIEEVFKKLTDSTIVIDKEKSGICRKPHPMIQFEDFGPQTSWVAFVALEPNVVKTWKHIETGAKTVFSVADSPESVGEFINNNCSDETKWETFATINMDAGDLVLIKPWTWHSLEKKLVKVFYLESQVNGNEVQV